PADLSRPLPRRRPLRRPASDLVVALSVVMLALGASIHALFWFSVEATLACGRAKAWILTSSARMTILGDQSPIHDQPDSSGPDSAMTVWEKRSMERLPAGSYALARRRRTGGLPSSSNSSASFSIMVPPSCSASTMVTARR